MANQKMLKPDLGGTEVVINLVYLLYGFKVKSTKELKGYRDRNYFLEVDATYENPHITSLWEHGYVIKVWNHIASQTLHIDAQHIALGMMCKQGISCPEPVLNKHGKEKAFINLQNPKEGLNITLQTNDCEGEFWHPRIFSGKELNAVTMLKYIPGEMVANLPLTPAIMYEMGSIVADVDIALKDLSHPGIKGVSAEDLIVRPSVRKNIAVVKDKNRQEIFYNIVDAFEREIVPNVHKFQKGVIHGDGQKYNILAQAKNTDAPNPEEKEYHVTSIIDMGNMAESYYLFEVAYTIAGLLRHEQVTKPLEVAGHVLASYMSKIKFNSDEFEALKLCICARMARVAISSNYQLTLQPDNPHMIELASMGWPQLVQFWNTPNEELQTLWKKVMVDFHGFVYKDIPK